MAFLLFLAFAAASLAFGRWVVRRINARLERQRGEVRALAARRGWQVDPDVRADDHYRLRGVTRGMAWEAVAERTGTGDDASVSTKWHTDVVHYLDLVVLVRTRKGFQLLESMWGKAASGLLAVMTTIIGAPAPQHTRLARDGRRLQGRSPGFDDAFVAVVRPDAGLDDVITAAVEKALLAWTALPLPALQRDSLSVDVGQTNLRVYCSGALDAVSLERLVQIGEAFGESITRQR